MFPGISLFPEQASALAADVDHLYFFITAVAAFFALVVTIFVIYFAAKYRDDDPMAVGARIEGSLPLELAWSIVPFLITSSSSSGAPASSSTSTARRIRRWRSMPQANAGCGSSSTWVARTRSTSFMCPWAARSRSLSRPRTCSTRCSSRHFESRRMRFPAATAALVRRRRSSGEFHLFCAEYCGTKHSGMVGSVFVMEPDGISGMAERHAGGGDVDLARRATVRRSRLRHLPFAATEAGRGHRWPTSSGRPNSSRPAGGSLSMRPTFASRSSRRRPRLWPAISR